MGGLPPPRLPSPPAPGDYLLAGEGTGQGFVSTKHTSPLIGGKRLVWGGHDCVCEREPGSVRPGDYGISAAQLQAGKAAAAATTAGGGGKSDTHRGAAPPGGPPRPAPRTGATPPPQPASEWQLPGPQASWLTMREPSPEGPAQRGQASLFFWVGVDSPLSQVSFTLIWRGKAGSPGIRGSLILNAGGQVQSLSLRLTALLQPGLRISCLGY